MQRNSSHGGLLRTSNLITLNFVFFTKQVASSLPFDYAQGIALRNDNE
jgi:hypothetical protein